MDFGWPYDVFRCFKKGCHDRFVEMARTVLLQYIPMEEDVKMYSILGCGRTLDAIREEAFSNIDQILELGKSDEIVAQSFKRFLASMIKRRYCILKYLCLYASYGDYVTVVEHLVVATNFQMSKRRLRKNIIEFNNIPCMKKFIEAVREYKRKYQEHLIIVNSWDNKYPDDQSSDISSNAELGDKDDEYDVDTELDNDTELDDYCSEYVNKSKIKTLRKRKKVKNYKWGGSIRSKILLFHRSRRCCEDVDDPQARWG
ncbi:hypothetical protein PTKIN_Ptkin14bG0215000 [Pterospermum kingtungense]